MKATVQYDDFTGTAAADISDQSNLVDYLSTRGANTKRYRPVGVEFYSGLRSCSASIICVDEVKSTEKKKHLVKVPLGKDMEWKDFFILFKRFRVILTDRIYNEDELEFNEENIIEKNITDI